MSRSFTKLFSSITESTVWCEPSDVRIVWICMLAMADAQGRVWASVPGLANRARVPVEATRDAIARFLEPDTDSRTKDHDGRRIEAIDGGWRLLNHAKYRAIQQEADKREADAERQRKHREAARSTGNSHALSRSVTDVTAGHSESREVAEAEAEAEADKEEKSMSPALLDDAHGGASANGKTPACPQEQIVALYHRHLPANPAVRVWDDRRRRFLASRWREDAERQSVEWWDRFFGYVAKSKFLTGKVNGHGDRTFLPSLEWIVRPQNFVKIIEGNYEG